MSIFIKARRQTQIFWSIFWVVLFLSPWLLAQEQELPDSIEILAEVDATQLPRHLLKASLQIPVQPGMVHLWYPRYIPGIHGPGYQIQNMGGFEVYAASGERLSWKRDPTDLYRFKVIAPKDCFSLTVKLTYIANQPTQTSRGVDTYGNNRMLAINFNTCLLYPESWNARQTAVTVRLKLPPNWSYASALKLEKEEKEWLVFEGETLEDLVDSPLIAGQFLRTLEFKTPHFPKGFLHFTTESENELQLDPRIIDAYGKLFQQAYTLFGFAPFSEYHFLVLCSNRISGLGLEHSSSSLNAVGTRDLVDLHKTKGWAAYLLPHEFTHAWCGKYRRPAGMYRENFHSYPETELLWVYEGLTQYLGELLTVRAGFLSFEDYLKKLTTKIEYLKNRTGRKWRSLEDTAICGHSLRGGSPYWADLRRDQDYYNEGVLFWMEVDALLREKSQHQVSLDTFCRIFFGQQGEKRQKISLYTLENILSTLQSLVPYEWESLIRKRIQEPMDSLSLDFLANVGYSFQENAESSPAVLQVEYEQRRVHASASLGILVAEDGKITTVLPEKLGDQAGLIQGMKILAIHRKTFSTQRLREAIQQKTSEELLELLIQDGEEVRTVFLPYKEGAKYVKLERLLDTRDLLKEMCQAR